MRSLCALLLLLPGPALAIRPFLTDDARVVGKHLVQLETWLQLEVGVVLQHGVMEGHRGRRRVVGRGRAPMLTRKAMSTTSSPGRRPLGKPAGSHAMLVGGSTIVGAIVAVRPWKHSRAPRLFWLPFAVAGTTVLSLLEMSRE